MKMLTQNVMTDLGTDQFIQHTKLMTTRVKDVLSARNPIVSVNESLTDALVKMTESGFGCVSVTDDSGKLVGAFTDGDLRRLIEKEGKDGLQKNMGDFDYNPPITIDGNALLNEATQIFHERNVDNIIVLNGDDD